MRVPGAAIWRCVVTRASQQARSEDSRGWILRALAGDGACKGWPRVRDESLKTACLLTELITILYLAVLS